MHPVRPAENRPGPGPQIFSSRSNPDFSNAGDRLGKIPPRRAGGKNLSGSNRRTVFSRANATGTYYLPPHHKPDNNKKPLTQCPFFRSKPSMRDMHEKVEHHTRRDNFDAAGVEGRLLVAV